MFRPWLDSLGDEFRLLYVDQRSQAMSDRVDPTTLTLRGQPVLNGQYGPPTMRLLVARCEVRYTGPSHCSTS